MNRDTQTTALSDRESGTFLYEIDRHFNPYAPDGGYQTQVVFFLHGLKADKRFYYDHVLPAATIPEILHEHFRHQFDVIGYFGFDLTESAYGLRIWQGRELDRALRQEQASREPEPAPAEHPAMAAMQQDLWEEYDNTMARLPSEEEKNELEYKNQPTTALQKFHEQYFRHAGQRAMLIVDESGPAMTAHVQANNSGHFFQYIQSWCRNADLREAGHAIFLISKLSLNDFLERYHQDIRNFDGTDYLQTIPIHDHTEKELSRYLLMRAARQDTDPYEIQNVGNIAGMLSNHARQSDEFGIDEIETHMQNPHRWQQYLQDVASGGGFDVADLDLQGLQQHFDEKLIGQQHIKDQLVKALSRLKKYGVPKSKQNQPLFVGLFAGPTGVGKTEIARQISQYVFNRPPCHLEFNTLTSEADVYKIFGAPPGYVGYGEPTQLEQYLAAHNYGVIILDEIEKAHPTIHNQFYRVLDESVTESTGSGQILRFGNTIILATSNAGDRIDSQNPNASREQRQTYYEQVIRDVFAPPLYGRLTKYTGSQPLIFDAFNAEQQRDIARLYLRLALKTLRNDYPKGQDFQVTASEAFWSAFVKRAGNGTGARGLEAMIETVAEQLFFGHLENRLPERVELDWHHTDFTINGDPVDLF